MKRQLEVISLNDYADLCKAHVKAHFRRDPRTGKLQFIKDYDNKIHGTPDLTIQAGKKMLIDNPKSMHHGKVADIKGYVTPANGKKKPYVTVTVDGRRADLKPHHFKPLPATSSVPAAPAAPVKPTSAPTAPITTMIAARHELGLLGLSYASGDLQHEINRIQTMSPDALSSRLDKITNIQKLYNFYRVLDTMSFANLPTPQKVQLKDKAKNILIKFANDHKNQAQPPQKAAQPPQPANPVQPAQPTPATPKTPPAASGGIDIGSIVEIQTGKYAGKKAKVTHMGGKYGVRVRVDLDGSGKYTKIAEYKKPSVNFKGVTTSPAPVRHQPGTSPTGDGTRGKDKQKRKTRSDKGTGNPDEKETGNQTPVLDDENIVKYANDIKKAYPLAKNEWKNIANTVGILPLDEGAKDMMIRSMDQMVKFNGSAVGKDPYSVPRWVRRLKNSNQLSLMTAFGASDYIDSDLNSSKIASFALNTSKEDWEKVGYDYDKEIKPALDGIKQITEKYQGFLATAYAPSALNNVFDKITEIHQPPDLIYAGRLSKTAQKLKDKGISIDSKLVDILNDEAFKEDCSFKIDPQETLKYACTFANLDPDPNTTVRDIISAIYRFKTDAKQSELDEIQQRITNNVGLQRLHLNDKAHNPFQRIYYKAAPNNFDDALEWNNRNTWKSQGTSDSNQVFEHLLGIKKFTGRNFVTSHSCVFANKSYLINNRVAEELKKQYNIDDPEHKGLIENLQANMIMADYVDRSYNKKMEFKPALFHKDHITEVGYQFAGYSIGRKKSKSSDFHVQKMVTKYMKARKKNANAGKGSASDTTTAKATLRKVDQATFDDVVKRIGKSWDTKNHGGFSFKVHGVYQVGACGVYDKFEKINKERNNAHFVYHGTATSKAANILRTEFRTTYVNAGRMLGSGVYTTRTASKASQYLLENFNFRTMRQWGNRGVLFVAKASFGKTHDRAYDATNNDQSPNTWNGNHSDAYSADTIYAPKGKRVPNYSGLVLNDEYCVKKNTAVLPVFWIDLELVNPAIVKKS